MYGGQCFAANMYFQSCFPGHHASVANVWPELQLLPNWGMQALVPNMSVPTATYRHLDFSQAVLTAATLYPSLTDRRCSAACNSTSYF